MVAAQKGTTVTVEGLFKNLPVRRQELQRNIKREWTKVINVVGQYACIQAGVKITVTHQPLKGKKTTIFATRGNKTTRENIANVFGAKTLSALILLDLKLELEPTSGPPQRWGTQEYGPSKEVRIVGHISKPVFGEGRQTPDKQMFFVNSRPCGLPQVAKVFNEVYRSFNNAQSPFIFANIEMDTHGYDVNVSPDKRTIMLHEQSRMLEALRTELTRMFSEQDYSVPTALTTGGKLPTYKQLTISREVPNASSPVVPKTPAWEATGASKTPTRSTSATDDEAQDEISVPRRPSAAASRDQAVVNLINKWSDNHAEDRPLPKLPKDVREATAMSGATGTNGLSKEKLKLMDKFPRERLTSAGPEDEDMDTEGEEEQAAPMGEALVVDETPQAVNDFNAYIASLPGSRQGSVVPSEATPHRIAPIFTHETPIPAVPSPILRTNSKINSIMGRITRPRRVSEEEATITIDGRTITSSIGTPSKRQRVESSPANSTPSSAFGSRLSQKFSAPGTRVGDGVTSEVEDKDQEMAEGEDVEVEDNGGKIEEGEESLFIEQDGDRTMPEAGVQIDQDSVDDSIQIIDDGGQAAVDDPSLLESENAEDDAYIDDSEKKAFEDAKVAAMIAAAEAKAAMPTEENVKRAKLLLKPKSGSKNATVHLSKTIHTNAESISAQFATLELTLANYEKAGAVRGDAESGLNSVDAEERLSLTIHKSDFAQMNIVGQFNLGFILATRTSPDFSDDLFIIDQHASDEKYNFERLQANTVVQSQRLVRPKQLSLTAVEEEIVIEHQAALEANGFLVAINEDAVVGERCQLVSLPLSREITFTLRDLEELISLLSESPPATSFTADATSTKPRTQRHIPRPSRVRAMFAMRACRSSVMIGKSLSKPQMRKLVRNMGTIEKPWNCPHGRPTMRHLCGLGVWDTMGWEEGMDDKITDWTRWVNSKRP